MGLLSTFATWSRQRWLVAAAASVGFAVLIAIPTDLIDTPLFGRMIPPAWWSWPALVVTAVLGGLLAATYVNPRIADRPVQRRGGYAAAFLTIFGVGCPVCNKLVLVALGSTGAVAWFQPLQPILTAAAVVLLLVALVQRLRGELACPVSIGSPAAERV